MIPNESSASGTPNERWFIACRKALVNRGTQAQRKQRLTPATVLIGLTLAGAVAAPSLDRGGFTGGGQKILLILAAAVLVEVMLLLPDAFATSMRSPIAIILFLLGLLTSLSALWTIGAPGNAVRWGLVIVAYGSLTVAAGAFAARCGPWPIAIAIAMLAALEASLGLGSAALRHASWAELLGGSWRPSGTYGYAPALGLLQVCGLPVALRAAASDSRVIAHLGAFGLALAGATLGCVDSRMDLALAAAALVFLGVLIDRDQVPRHDVLAAGATLAAAAVAAALLLGRHATTSAHRGSAIRLAGITLTCILVTAAWPLLRKLTRGIRIRHLAVITVVTVATTGAVWLVAGYASTVVSTGGGLGHGRISYWTAAIDTWEQRPILGSGAGTFYQASVSYQASNDRTIFAHNLPLELAAELGLLGFILGLSLYAAVTVKLRKAINTPNAWLLAPTVGGFLLANLVDWPWHLSGLGAAWAAAVGGLSCFRRSNRLDPRRSIDGLD